MSDNEDDLPVQNRRGGNLQIGVRRGQRNQQQGLGGQLPNQNVPNQNVPNQNVPNQNVPNQNPPRGGIQIGVGRGQLPNQNLQNNNLQNNNLQNINQPQTVLGVQIPQDQRQWSVNVLRVLGWSSKRDEHQNLNNDITGLLQQVGNQPSDLVNQMQVEFQQLSLSLGQNGIWNSTEEMKASEIKATLAFEQMPNKQARLQTGSANPTFWVDGPPDPITNETRQYIFKPAMKGFLMSGMSSGGEPTREGLAGRVSEMLQAYSGLDFNMPLTNVISVDRTRLDQFQSNDPGSQIVEGNIVSGSLQQFKPSDGDLRANLCTRKGDVSPQSCQNVAMLDTIMLNLDRHDGNLLMGKNDTGLIPIDHGLSFPSTSVLGTSTITENMAGEKNVLLRLPGSYDAFSPESLDGLDKLDPSILIGALKGEIVKMEQLHEGTQGTVTQSSLSITELTTRFLKRAAPTLAPAVLQMALASNADKLLDPEFGRDQNAWNNLADEVIQEFGAKAAQLKEFWMLPGDERDAIINKLVADRLIDSRPIEYDWILKNIDVVLAYGRSNVAPPQAPNRQQQQPQDLDAQQTKEEIRSVLPKITLDRKKEGEWVAAWKRIRRAGGTAEVEQVLLQNPKRSFKTLQEVLDAINSLKSEREQKEWEAIVNNCRQFFPQYTPPENGTMSDGTKLRGTYEAFRRAGGLRAMRAAMLNWPNRPPPRDPFEALMLILSPLPDRDAAAVKGLDYLDRVVLAEQGLVSQPLQQEIQQLRTDIGNNQVNGDPYDAVIELSDRVLGHVVTDMRNRFLALKPRIALVDQTGFQWKNVEQVLTAVQAGKVLDWIGHLRQMEQQYPAQNQQNDNQQH